MLNFNPFDSKTYCGYCKSDPCQRDGHGNYPGDEQTNLDLIEVEDEEEIEEEEEVEEEYESPRSPRKLRDPLPNRNPRPQRPERAR